MAYSRSAYAEAGYPRGFDTIIDFTEHYGLVKLFTPFKWRDPEPFELHRQVSEYVAEQPDTSSSFTKRSVVRNIDADLDSKQHRRLRDHLYTLGSWPCDTEKSRTRWGNPSYMHGETVDKLTDPDARREHAAVAASCGFVDAYELGDAWGVESMNDALDRLDGFAWEDARREGAKNMCRTVQTAAEWSDRTLQELLETLDVPRRTYYEWRDRYELADFEPPTPPSEVYESWPENG